MQQLLYLFSIHSYSTLARANTHPEAVRNCLSAFMISALYLDWKFGIRISSTVGINRALFSWFCCVDTVLPSLTFVLMWREFCSTDCVGLHGCFVAHQQEIWTLWRVSEVLVCFLTHGKFGWAIRRRHEQRTGDSCILEIRSFSTPIITHEVLLVLILPTVWANAHSLTSAQQWWPLNCQFWP